MNDRELMIFFNLGWMKNYQGITEDDSPERGGGWVGEHGWDHSMLNFLPQDGFYYGYGQAGNTGVKLERLGLGTEAAEAEGVTVVWVSTPPGGGAVIIGWYTDALLFRDYKTPDPSFGREWKGEPVFYNARTRVENGILLPIERRAFKIPRGKGGMGQSNVWYADKPEHESFKQRVREYIASGGTVDVPSEPRTWIFQANPSLYNIDAAVKSLVELPWLVTSHKHEILPYDRVYCWRSGKDAAIIGEARVLTKPALMTFEPSDLILDPEKFTGTKDAVKLQITKSLGAGIPRNTLEADPRLKNLSILKFSQGTNFPVTEEEAAAIEDLIERGDISGTDDVEQSISDDARSGRTWAYAPGPGARHWEEFYRNGIVAIGWEELGDLKKYPTIEAFAEALKTRYHLTHEPMNDSRACFDFVHTMAPGDRVIAKRGRDQIVGFGVVTGEYRYAPERQYYQHVRDVRWERRGLWNCKPVFAVKTLTDLTNYPETVRELTELIGVEVAGPPRSHRSRCLIQLPKHYKTSHSAKLSFRIY